MSVFYSLKEIPALWWDLSYELYSRRRGSSFYSFFLVARGEIFSQRDGRTKSGHKLLVCLHFTVCFIFIYTDNWDWRLDKKLHNFVKQWTTKIICYKNIYFALELKILAIIIYYIKKTFIKESVKIFMQCFSYFFIWWGMNHSLNETTLAQSVS